MTVNNNGPHQKVNEEDSRGATLQCRVKRPPKCINAPCWEVWGASNEPYRTERQPRLGRTTAWGPILIRRRFRLARNKSSCLEKRLLPHGGPSLHDYIPKIDVFVPSIYDLVVYVLFSYRGEYTFAQSKLQGTQSKNKISESG